MWVDRESGVDLLSYEPFAELVKIYYLMKQ